MKTFPLSLGGDLAGVQDSGVPAGDILLRFPDSTDVYRMASPAAIPRPGLAVRTALKNPIACKPLPDLSRESILKAGNHRPQAVILASDNTRPVPYTGEPGILLPVVEVLLRSGYAAGDILVLIAAGTHRSMEDWELRAMIDPKIFELGVPVLNHDCRDTANLVRLGLTRRGGEIFINRRYLDADLKILTGLVESHFMAGFSGGRKSICPGIIGEKSTFVFHGPSMMAHPDSRDLLLAGNPCHEEALEVAKMAGADFIVNVTVDHSFNITGVFAGDPEAAHEAAAATVKSYVEIPADGEYDIVVSHAGYVGSNHYQAAKAAVASLGILKAGGHLILIADNRDPVNAVGSLQYRTALQLLKLLGPDSFLNLIQSKEWVFLPDQWQVQMWTKLFHRIPPQHFYYFAPQLDDRHWQDLPGIDGRRLLHPENRKVPCLQDAPEFVEAAIGAALSSYPPEERADLRIAFLADGPYGIPRRK
jgi:nickel-dependent lactate racemase